MPDGVANTAQLVSEGSSKLTSVLGEHINEVMSHEAHCYSNMLIRNSSLKERHCEHGLLMI
jgi:hypothetical protein